MLLYRLSFLQGGEDAVAKWRREVEKREAAHVAERTAHADVDRDRERRSVDWSSVPVRREFN